MLVRLSGLQAAGIYGAAYRIIDAAFAPAGALVYAAYARFFHHGANGIGEGLRFARKLLAYSIPYGLLTMTVLMLAAPVLPKLLGSDFTASSAALLWLSPLVLFKCIHYFFADCLSGAGFQGIRAAIQLIVAGGNVGLNLWLIPAYSWKGAAWASLASDGLFATAVWATTALLVRHSGVEVLQPQTGD
jgi:O-antigen/teichoic acid export membrane protein